MPTPPGFADISCQLTSSATTRPAYITFGVDPTNTALNLIAADVLTAWNASTSMKSIIDSNVTLSQIRVSLGTDGSADLAQEFIVSSPGSAAASSVPPNVALLVHKSTGRGGRRGRGRLFIPWAVEETSVDEGGIIGSAYLTAFDAALANFLGALATNNVPMYLLHGSGASPPGAPDLVTGLKADRLVSTQKRRLGRR